MDNTYLRAKSKLPKRPPPDIELTKDEIGSLFNELQVYQLELEMQNDELKASYQILNEERAKFVGLYDLAPVGYFIINYLGIIEDSNQNGVDLLSTSKSGMVGRRFQNFIASHCWDDFYSFLYQIQNGDGKKSTEIQLQLPGKEIVYTRIEGIAIPSLIATDIRYYIAVIDITASRNAQQVLRETKERLEMTLSASSTGTWTSNFESNLLSLDIHSLSILGLDKWKFDSTIESFLDIIEEDDSKQVRQHFLDARKGAKEIDIQFRINSNNGIRYIAAKGNQMSIEGGGDFFAGILTDITERKKLEFEAESLKSDQQKLILSATLSAQEKERNNISRALHDSVCQVLYGIKLNLEGIERANYNKGEFKNINQLLDQAIKETRQLSYELTPSVLKDFGFVAGVNEIAQRFSTSKFVLKTSVDSALDQLTEELQLYIFRMIQELINNCIKHAKASRAEIIVNLTDNQVFIQVSDNGLGMNMEVEEAIRKGSGLSAIKNKLFLLNGQINYRNSTEGLTVMITLTL